MRYAIISAGEGSRIAAEGSVLPKPIIPILGVPMIERLLDIFMRNGADRIAVIVNGENRDVVGLLSSLCGVMPIDLVVKKTPTPMHSLMELAPYLGCGRFCVTTVDTVFYEARFAAMMDEFSVTNYDGMMGVTDFIDDEKPLYVSVDREMGITGFLDSGEGCRYVSAGIYALQADALDILARCIDSGQTRMRYFQRQLLESGMKLRAFDMGEVVDVDHVSDIAKAELIAAKRV